MENTMADLEYVLLIAMLFHNSLPQTTESVIRSNEQRSDYSSLTSPGDLGPIRNLQKLTSRKFGNSYPSLWISDSSSYSTEQVVRMVSSIDTVGEEELTTMNANEETTLYDFTMMASTDSAQDKTSTKQGSSHTRNAFQTTVSNNPQSSASPVKVTGSTGTIRELTFAVSSNSVLSSSTRQSTTNRFIEAETTISTAETIDNKTSSTLHVFSTTNNDNGSMPYTTVITVTMASRDEGLGPGVIVIIVLGSVFLLCVVAGVFLWFIYKKCWKIKRKPSGFTSNMQSNYVMYGAADDSEMHAYTGFFKEVGEENDCAYYELDIRGRASRGLTFAKKLSDEEPILDQEASNGNDTEVKLNKNEDGFSTQTIVESDVYHYAYQDYPMESEKKEHLECKWGQDGYIDFNMKENDKDNEGFTFGKKLSDEEPILHQEASNGNDTEVKLNQNEDSSPAQTVVDSDVYHYAYQDYPIERDKKEDLECKRGEDGYIEFNMKENDIDKEGLAFAKTLSNEEPILDQEASNGNDTEVKLNQNEEGFPTQTMVDSNVYHYAY